MDVQFLDDQCMQDYHSNVDTSRPFRSVKEAVAIFGEKFLAREIYPPKNFTFSNQETPHYSSSPLLSHDIQPKYLTSPEQSFIASDEHHASRKLEAKLEETKMEVKILKERKFETDVALASLDADLHISMSKLALTSVKSRKYGDIEEEGEAQEENERDLTKTTTLAKKLCIWEEEGLVIGVNKRKEKKAMKKKNIITLVGGLFARKKWPCTSMHNPLFS